MTGMHSSGEDPVLDVRVLGPTEVSVAGVALSLDRPLERALAVRLALARGTGVPDDALAKDLWGEADLARPAERLRVLASRLRRSLGEHAGAVQRTPAGFALRATPADLTTAEGAIARANTARRKGDEATARTATAEALELWRGPALADLRGIPFAGTEGLRLDALRLDLQVEWIEAELGHGSGAARLQLEQLAAEHPLHERLVCLSALSLYRAGRQADALDRLAKLRAALAEELGVDPSPATAELELRLLRQDPGLDGPPAPAAVEQRKPDGLPKLNWPTAATAFVGREGEHAQLVEQLGEPTLLTLIGGPGTGKTRLAREVAATVQDAGRPVGWLDLAPLNNPDAVAPALIAALGVEANPADPAQASADALGGALLVVDNAEHLIEAVASLVGTLQLKTPGLSVLVTSQRPLRISGEEVHQVGALPPYAAVRLFCSHSGAEPDEQVNAICAAVDRLPLGIELAAGLTRTLTVPQLAGRINDRLRLLVGGPRDAGERHTSLRAALDWSYDLLGSQERTVLRRMSVFAGGCTLEAAEQVLAGDGIEAADLAVLLGELADRCLVTVHASTGVRRFGLLESVREYARDLLSASGEQNDVRRRHATWCTELADRTAQYGGADHVELERELADEEANLRAALEWSLEPGGDATRVQEIVPPSWWYWWIRGLMSEAMDWLRRSLELTDPAPSVERAAALRAAASLARNSGYLTEARELGQRALDVCAVVGDDRETMRAVLGLAITALALRDFDAALQLGTEARDRASIAGNERGLCSALNMIGLTVRCLGRTAEAAEIFTETLKRWVALDDRRGIAGTEANLGIVARQSGDPAGSREWFLVALRRYREIGLVEGELDCLDGIALLDVAEGRPAAALQLLIVTDRHRARLGAPLFVADEIADRAAALAEARTALGTEADRTAEAARELRLDALVDALLASDARPQSQPQRQSQSQPK